ncbi:serine hydrolase domain-containing protein [uncultured Winogradskyella sp.]|uniref:serine hydrolase domain-containing protein n=1 Tax=uncultured Winogradskyella sp. TaxID=395353 RepID=UPI003510FC47
MKRTIGHLILLWLCLQTSGFSQANDDLPTTALKALVFDNAVIGASAGYAVDGTIVWQGTEGYANEDTKETLEIDTKLRTASIAKSMTAVAVMQLVEEGLINLDAPINEYVPEFIQPHQTKITTRHLLSHTSGIDAYKNKGEVENKKHFKSLMEVYDEFKERKLRFEPGTEFYYTSYGYVMLGILIERISGESYEAYIQENIWGKANMTNTGVENRDSLPKNTSSLYHKARNGKIKLADGNDLSNRIPAGGLYSTTPDLLNFGIALLNNTLISKESLDLMTEHHSLDKYNNGYGFGFYLYGKPDVNDIYGHNGAQTGASSQLFIVPSLNLVTVAMSNTSNAGREISTLAAKLIDISQQN